MFEYVNQAVEYNDIINVSTKNGNAVIMSEEEYNGLMETLHLSADSRVKKEILGRSPGAFEELCFRR